MVNCCDWSLTNLLALSLANDFWRWVLVAINDPQEGKLWTEKGRKEEERASCVDIPYGLAQQNEVRPRTRNSRDRGSVQGLQVMPSSLSCICAKMADENQDKWSNFFPFLKGGFIVYILTVNFRVLSRTFSAPPLHHCRGPTFA
jgi:hypothetical protein